MVALGDLQSLLELYTGLGLGFGGLVSVIGDPVRQEVAKYRYVKQAVASASENYSSNSFSTILTEMEKKEKEEFAPLFSGNIDPAEPSKFYSILFFGTSIISIILLFFVSLSSANTSLSGPFVAIIGALYAVLLIAVAWFFWKHFSRSLALRKTRKNFHDRYMAQVTA